MAKKKINIDKYASGLFLRTEEYADKVRQHYAAAVEELLKLSAKRHISPGETFSFADNKKLSESANIVLRGLYSAVYNEIKNGIAAEWQYANLSCDALIESIFGKGIMSDNHFAHWFSRNQDAMDAFFARKSAYGGMNLSQKVWKYTGELKTEMELALTLSMGEGEGASVISRKVRQYLQEPERLFRRIKTGTDANGEPLYKLSKAAKAYHPGRGVYRSSYKNAMRLTRTETNMAYRTADYTRWQQLPFVVGVRVKLSKNHNCIGVPKGQFYDICDELAGDYPKDFKLVGWHPQCRCFTEPILAEEDEFVAIQKRVLAGEDVQSYNSVNEVKAMPKQMVKWMEKNKERMDAASTLPYWLQDNKKLIKKPTAAEIAKRRHEARTDEDVKRLQDFWEKKRAEGSERRAIHHYGEHILEYMQGISDVDTSALSDALKSGDTHSIYTEALKLKSTGKKILSLDRLDNPMDVARKYSMKDAIAVNKAVTDRMAKESPDFYHLKDFLEREIIWVEKHKKYSTWKIAQDAYKKELRIIEHKIEIKSIADSVSDAIAYGDKSKSKSYKALVDEMKSLLSYHKLDIEKARIKAKELNDNFEKLQKKSKRRTVSTPKTKYETIDDIKKRMGANTPKTLENLESAIKDYEKTGKYGSIAKEHKEEIENIMKKVLDENDFGMNIDDNNLELVLDSWFKNTFETGSSGGYVGGHETTGQIKTDHKRLGAAHELFGLSPDLKNGQLPRHQYEKYGSLLDHDILSSMDFNPAQMYGNVEVRFKKDKVLATWTAGDSLARKYQPSLVTDPRSCSFDDILRTAIDASDANNFSDFRNYYARGYFELQYHGDLTVDCVDSLTFPYDLLKSKYLDIAKRWKKLGAKIYYISDGKLSEL